MEPPHVGCYQLRSPHMELALKQEVFDEGNRWFSSVSLFANGHNNFDGPSRLRTGRARDVDGVV
jgi:hypothetical protein